MQTVQANGTNSARWIYWEKCKNWPSAQNFQVVRHRCLYNLMYDHGCTSLAAMVMDVQLHTPIARKTSPCLKDSHVVAGSTLWNQTMEVIQMASRRSWWGGSGCNSTTPNKPNRWQSAMTLRYDTCWMTLSLRHGVPWWFRKVLHKKKFRFHAALKVQAWLQNEKWSELVPYSYNFFPISISGVNWIRLIFFFCDIRYSLYRDGVKICFNIKSS